MSNIKNTSLKDYILDASKKNDLDTDQDTFDKFIGIIIFSIFNVRESYRDYWSEDDLLHSDIVSRTMSRNSFENIKSLLKTSESSNRNDGDKIWKVRATQYFPGKYSIVQFFLFFHVDRWDDDKVFWTHSQFMKDQFVLELNYGQFVRATDFY